MTTPSPQGGDIPPEHGISVLYDCFLLAQRLRPVLARGLDGAPLRGDEYAVYSLLAEQGPLSPTVLARRTGDAGDDDVGPRPDDDASAAT